MRICRAPYHINLLCLSCLSPEDPFLHSHLLLYLTFIPPSCPSSSAAPPLPISLLSLCLPSSDRTINHRDWEGLVCVGGGGLFICTLCKLSGHDELAALNRPLLTDTGDTSISRHETRCDLSKKPWNWRERGEKVNKEWKYRECRKDIVELLGLKTFHCKIASDTLM